MPAITQTPVAATARPGQKLPAGLRWSGVWRAPDGSFVEGDVEVPVDARLNIAGRLWVCPVDICDTAVWAITSDPDVRPDVSCCPKHPTQLLPAPMSADDRNPVRAGHNRVVAYLSDVVVKRRDRVAALAELKLQAARQAVTDASRRTATDMRGHVPSAAVSAGAWAAAAATVQATDPAITAAIGSAVGTAGTVAAYVLAYLWQKWQAHRDGVELVGRAGRRVRARARHIAAGPLAVGGWLAVASMTGVDPATLQGALWLLVAAPLLAWLVNRTHWDKLWADRRRLRDLARLKAEEAARRAAEEADRAREQAQAPTGAAVVVREDTPEAVGAWFAERWAQISQLDTVPVGFHMRRTRIVAEDTRAVTAPIDGEAVRIGWEFAGQAEPGALVGRPGMPSPLAGAREWLASVLERDPSTVSVVDRLDGQPNRFLVLLTDRAPLGGSVRWKGASGVRVASDGTIWVHSGRTILGEDVEEALYVPGQPFGGLTVGTTGGGKSAGTVLLLLNLLAGGIFPILDDPKQLLDYGDFIGVFPIGVSAEHSQVIAESLLAERRRREKHLSTRRLTDRHGRTRRQQPVWDIKRDGPPILAIYDEFHMRSKDQALMGMLTEQVRTQRAAAMGLRVITQGGGLADLNNSELRGLLNTVSMRLYRMADNLARLAGYSGDFPVSGLPRIPGVCLDVRPDAPPVPLRSAYVHQDLADGSVFDHLYGPNMEPLLTAPTLPAETVEVWERTGLMDLWRLGQGPDGLDRLLSDTPGPEGLTPPPAKAADGDGKMLADDVILAILQVSGGVCQRAAIQNHETWNRPLAGGAAPDPSTVSRAGKRLMIAGLIIRKDGEHRLLSAGEERAKAAAAALLSTPGPAAGAAHTRAHQAIPAAPMTAAEVERRNELLAEQASPAQT